MRATKKTATFILLLLLCGVTPGFSKDRVTLPRAPSDFVWHFFDAINAYLLVPGGWFVDFEKNSGVFACFITREDYSKTRSFSTGVTVQVIVKPRGVVSTNRIGVMVENLKKKNRIILLTGMNNGIFRGTIVQYNPEKSAFRIHEIILANTKTNTIYIVIFRCPEKSWSRSWPTGKTILNMLGFDPAL